MKRIRVILNQIFVFLFTCILIPLVCMFSLVSALCLCIAIIKIGSFMAHGTFSMTGPNDPLLSTLYVTVWELIIGTGMIVSLGLLSLLWYKMLMVQKSAPPPPPPPPAALQVFNDFDL